MWVSRKYWYPTTGGISLRTSPPPWIFHIYKKLVTPSTPPDFPQSKTKPPQPLWKSLFSWKNNYYLIKEWCRLRLCNGFHFILLNGLELEHSKLPTEQPKLQNIAYPLKWKRQSCISQLRMFALMCKLTMFFSKHSRLHDRNVDGINAISVWIRLQTCQTFNHKIKGKQKGE